MFIFFIRIVFLFVYFILLFFAAIFNRSQSFWNIDLLSFLIFLCFWFLFLCLSLLYFIFCLFSVVYIAAFTIENYEKQNKTKQKCTHTHKSKKSDDADDNYDEGEFHIDLCEYWCVFGIVKMEQKTTREQAYKNNMS